MRIGLVRFLNARPLDYGLRETAREGHLSVVEDTPARLFESLRQRDLDAALISSVEVLRHPELFGSCRSVGVCAERRVDSIVYVRRAGTEKNPPRVILTDQGSRSSVAVLQILLQREFPGQAIEWRSVAPEDIPAGVDADTAGLLIGDSALALRMRGGPPGCTLRDVAEWWYELEQLPFVFALWAYPRAAPISDAFFEDCLTTGLEHVEEIARTSGYPDALQYLTRTLHYRLTDRDREALKRFHSLLSAVPVL